MSALCNSGHWGGVLQRDSQIGILWNIDPAANEPHSALMLNAWITLPHFSVSSAMNFPNAADVIDIGSTPKLASRALMRGSATTALISLLSLSITSAIAPPDQPKVRKVLGHEPLNVQVPLSGVYEVAGEVPAPERLVRAFGHRPRTV